MNNCFYSVSLAILLASIVIGTAASSAIADSGGALTSVHKLFESKDKYMGPVATKISEFKDEAYVTSLSFSSDGKELATNFSQDLNIRIWEWQGQSRIVKTLQKPPFTGSVDLWDSLRFSPDGRLLAIAHDWSGASAGGSYIRVWNAKTWTIEHDVAEPTLGVKAGGLAFSPDGKFLVTAVEQIAARPGDPPIDKLNVYSTASWEPVWAIQISISPLTPSALALSSDGHLAAVAGTFARAGTEAQPMDVVQSKIMVVDLISRTAVKTLDPLPAQCMIDRLAWSVDGTRLAVGGMPFFGGCELKGSIVRVFGIKAGVPVSADESSDNTHVYGLSYTPDGKYLIEGGLHQSVRIWDSAQKTLLQTIPVDPTALAVSNDSRYLAIAVDHDIAVWELK